MTVIGLLAALGAGGAGGGCAGHGKGEAPTVTLPQPLPANSFALQWTTDLQTAEGGADRKSDKKPADPLARLFLRDNALFIYTQNHLVWSLNRAGGNIEYVAQPQISGGTLRPPLILGQYVLYPSGSTLEIFNDRGRNVRTLELEKPTRSAAAGAGNTVYIGLDHTGGTGVMASIDITKPYHFVNWELMTFGAITSTPIIYDRIIYCASEDGRIYAVTDERGSVWSLENGANWFQTQGRFQSDIKADDFGLYAANTDSKLYCLDRETGRIKWQYYAGAPLKTAPVVMKDVVYQYVPDQGIAAIDKTQGEFNRKPRWIVKGTVQFLSADDQNVYLRRRDNAILAVDKQSGNILFQSRTKAYELFAENTTDATIFAATKDGRVAAIRPILRAGEVGTVVMDLREQPLAAAR
jgi:outer membrane protein assembly factor BamB